MVFCSCTWAHGDTVYVYDALVKKPKITQMSRYLSSASLNDSGVDYCWNACSAKKPHQSRLGNIVPWWHKLVNQHWGQLAQDGLLGVVYATAQEKKEEKRKIQKFEKKDEGASWGCIFLNWEWKWLISKAEEIERRIQSQHRDHSWEGGGPSVGG